MRVRFHRSISAACATALCTGLALAGCSSGSTTSGESGQTAAMSKSDVNAQLGGTLPASVKAELNSAPPLSMGQPVPGYPNGVSPSQSNIFNFTPADIAKLKAGHFTAAVAMHEMDIGWSQLQLQGLKDTLSKFGIPIVAVTNASFNASTQASNVDTLIARHPSVIFSIPVNPTTEADAYKRIGAAGIKLVLMDNVPDGMAPGKDYVTVVSGNNGGDGAWAAQKLAQTLNDKGQIGFLGVGYYFFVITQRDNAVLNVLKKYPGIKVVRQSWTDPTSQAANEASAMLLKNPNMKGMWTSYTLPAASIISGEKSQGRKVLLATSDLDEQSALQVAQGWITATGAQQPYAQGVAEAESAAYSFLGKKVPPYIELPTVPVTRSDLIPAYQQVMHANPPADVIAALEQPPVQPTK
jgi:ribose transport system substrate-binding protein